MRKAVYSMGICGYVVWADADGENIWHTWVGSNREQKAYKSKARFTASGRAYFMAHGRRIHLDQCLVY